MRSGGRSIDTRHTVISPVGKGGASGSFHVARRSSRAAQIMRAHMIRGSIAVWDDGEHPAGHGSARMLFSAVGSVLSALSSQDRCGFPGQGMKVNTGSSQPR